MELIVTVHTDLLQDLNGRSALIQDREMNTRYQTNKKLKYVSAFYVLKSLSSSGVLKDYYKNAHKICLYLNCSLPTMYKILRYCENAGWLSRVGGNIALTSYENFIESFDIICTRFTKIKYDCTKHKFPYLMESAYLQLAEQKRAQTFESKFKAIPELVESLKDLVPPDNSGCYRKALQQIQIQTFIKGHAKKESIFYFNPFTTCNSKTLRSMFNFKSEQSVAYLKTKLQRNNVASVHECKVYSQERIHVKHLFIQWNEKKQQTIWIQPDRLEYAPILVT